MANRYSIDTSSLIEIKQRFPADVFLSLWQKLDELAASGRLIAADEVLREIEDDPDLRTWTRKHRKMFKKLDSTTIQLALEIVSRFPDLVDREKDTPDADPFCGGPGVNRESAATDAV